MAPAACDASVRINIITRSTIKASDPSTQHYVLPVSNLDLFVGSHPSTALYLYSKPSKGDFSSVVATMKRTLPHLLDHYFLLAGRITTNPKTGFPEITCNNEGAELVEAEANVPLACLDFHHVKDSLDRIPLPYAPDLALCVQLVRYACGGFSIAWRSSHVLMDGHNLFMIPNHWSELVRTNEIARIPIHDRCLIRPRSPPTYSPWFDRALTTITLDDMINVLASDIFVSRMYHVDAGDIDRIRSLCGRVGRRATATEAFSAYLWKVLARVVGESDTSCRMSWLVNGRNHIRSESKNMMDYVGNVISFATGEAGVADLTNKSMADVAGMVSEAIAEVTNEAHFQELVDWIECNKAKPMIARGQLGLGSPTIVLTAFQNSKVEMDFGFGRPVLAMPQLEWGRLGSAFVVVASNPNGDGSWVVSAYIWPKLAAALESDPDRYLKPIAADHLGLVSPIPNHQPLISRI